MLHDYVSVWVKTNQNKPMKSRKGADPDWIDLHVVSDNTKLEISMIHDSRAEQLAGDLLESSLRILNKVNQKEHDKIIKAMEEYDFSIRSSSAESAEILGMIEAGRNR